MSEAVFWMLISMLNWDESGDDEGVVAPAVEELSRKSVEEIQQFDDILASKLYALDTKAHAKQIGEDAYRDGEHFSVDWFLYARCAVVANGKELYQAVLVDPPSFPKNVEFESLLYIAETAFAEKTGEEYSYAPKISYETFSNESGWK